MNTLVAWLSEAVSLVVKPTPGTKAHREAYFQSNKEWADERNKPPGQRDEARLLELYKRVLRFKVEHAQFLQQDADSNMHKWSQPPSRECCGDCLLVRRRLAASCQAIGGWHAACAVSYAQLLQLLQEGKPLPNTPFPSLNLQLPADVPEQPAPSIDRCSNCQNMLDQYLDREQYIISVAALKASGGPADAPPSAPSCSTAPADACGAT